MTDFLQEWLKRKRAASYVYLQEPIATTRAYHKHLGPRYMFGEVTLSATLSHNFNFDSTVKWPTGNNDELVLDGILEVLLCYRHQPFLGVAVTLTAIGWHEIDSAPMGYYYAAKEATLELIEKGHWL